MRAPTRRRRRTSRTRSCTARWDSVERRDACATSSSCRPMAVRRWTSPRERRTTCRRDPSASSEGYAFAPDGKEIAYTAKDQGRAAAWSDDANIYVVPAAGGAATVITAAQRGRRRGPGLFARRQYIAYRSRARAGHSGRPWPADALRPERAHRTRAAAVVGPERRPLSLRAGRQVDAARRASSRRARRSSA